MSKKGLGESGLRKLCTLIKESLNKKVDKVDGKKLSTEDYTTAEKNKLDGLNNYILPTASEGTLGGIKVGNGLEMDGEVLNVTGGGGGGEPGPAGKDGTTFIPSVSEDGYISWTNDGDKPNPERVYIKGPKGDDGAPGEQGAKGDDGAPGQAGPQGPTGATPEMSVKVTTLGEDATATASFTGPPETPTLNLGIPRGKTGSTAMDITGNAATATRLKNSRLISLTGAVTGSANFDGSDDVIIETEAASSGTKFELLNVTSSSWGPSLPGGGAANATLTLSTLILDPDSQVILVHPYTQSMTYDNYETLMSAGVYASDVKSNSVTITAVDGNTAKTLEFQIIVAIVG